MNDFAPDTWVARADLLDSNLYERYLASVYFALQTFVPVGYGDIDLESRTERIIFTFLPIITVSVYTYLLENIARLFSNFDKRTEHLQVPSYLY